MQPRELHGARKGSAGEFLIGKRYVFDLVSGLHLVFALFQKEQKPDVNQIQDQIHTFSQSEILQLSLSLHHATLLAAFVSLTNGLTAAAWHLIPCFLRVRLTVV